MHNALMGWANPPHYLNIVSVKCKIQILLLYKHKKRKEKVESYRYYFGRFLFEPLLDTKFFK